MSGSSGNTSGGKGDRARTARGTNDDLVQRHGVGGPESTARTDASTDARTPRDGRGGARERDPDAPEERDEG